MSKLDQLQWFDPDPIVNKSYPILLIIYIARNFIFTQNTGYLLLLLFGYFVRFLFGHNPCILAFSGILNRMSEYPLILCIPTVGNINIKYKQTVRYERGSSTDMTRFQV